MVTDGVVASGAVVSGGGADGANWSGAGALKGGSSLSAKLRAGAAASPVAAPDIAPPDIMGSTLNLGAAGGGKAETCLPGCAPAAAADAFKGLGASPEASRSSISSSKFASSVVSPLEVLSSLAAKGEDVAAV